MPNRSRKGSWVPYALVWLPCFGLYAAGIAASGAPTGAAVRGALASVLPWALLGLLVLRAARALPWQEERRARFFLLHLALALGFVVSTAAAWFVLLVVERRIVMGAKPISFDARIIPWQLFSGTLVYSALVSVAYARQNAARVREQSARAARAELLRASAELALLRSQLNPHFILNTLHTLLGLVGREPHLAEQAIERLGDLLHYGLRLHREAIDEVTLREEWEFVRGYLELEGLRLGERLRLQTQADEEVMECLVPAFVLQPLVENAILHAIAPRAQGGSLAIHAHRMGEELRLEVRDDGSGASSSALEGQGGLGLRLLKERLQALYADAASLSLHPGSPGLHAEILLPIRHSREADSA